MFFALMICIHEMGQQQTSLQILNFFEGFLCDLY